MRNGSSEPIYDAGVYIDEIEDGAPFIWFDTIPPGAVDTEPWNPPDQRSEPHPVLSFYDSAGVCWYRDRNGTLRRAPQSAQNEP